MKTILKELTREIINRCIEKMEVKADSTIKVLS